MPASNSKVHEYLQGNPMPLPRPPLNTDGTDGTFTDMSERIAKLEGAVEGLRHSQNLMLGAIGLVVALGIGYGVYSIQRLDQLNDKLVALPGQISAELRDINKTLATAITASKQTPPQVIVYPAPALAVDHGGGTAKPAPAETPPEKK